MHSEYTAKTFKGGLLDLFTNMHENKTLLWTRHTFNQFENAMYTFSPLLGIISHLFTHHNYWQWPWTRGWTWHFRFLIRFISFERLVGSISFFCGKVWNKKLYKFVRKHFQFLIYFFNYSKISVLTYFQLKKKITSYKSENVFLQFCTEGP